MQAINITVVQTTLHWENVDLNLAHFSKKLEPIEQTDLIILPEMFTTGFSMNPENLAKESSEKGLAWMQAMAKSKNGAVTGSLMFEDNGTYYNSLLFVLPDGTYQRYNKRHLFSLAEENQHFTRGHERLIVEYMGWKICPLICFDLRFPVFSRNNVNYDLLIYVANWPEKRHYAWQQLLKARAIENQSYVIACNRLGEDGNGIPHKGGSAIINYVGEEIGFDKDDNIFQFNLNKEPQALFRKEFPFLNEQDQFELL